MPGNKRSLRDGMLTVYIRCMCRTPPVTVLVSLASTVSRMLLCLQKDHILFDLLIPCGINSESAGVVTNLENFFLYSVVTLWMMLQGNVYVHVVNMKRAAVECYFRDVSVLAFTSSVVIVFYVVFTCNPFIDDVGWMTDRTVFNVAVSARHSKGLP